MKHPDDDELFNRLEAEMAAEGGADVVDLDKARAARESTPTGPEVDDPTAPVMVDQSTPTVTGPGYLGRLAAARRRPVVPIWLRSVAELRTASAWVARHYAHTIGYHALRAPVYAARLTFQAPTGAARFVGGTMRWVADREGEPVRLAAVRREDAAEYLKLSRQRDGRVRLRTLVAVLALFVGLATALAIYVLAPAWLQAVSVSAVVLALGAAGRKADAPVIHRAVELPKATKLTSDIVLRALGSLGISAISQAQAKGRDGFEFTAPITRDGPGWRAEGNLPFGVTVTDIIERRERLASGLRRPLGCVWPEAVPDEHTGHLVLWVGDQDMNKAKKPAWPLAKSGTVDLFKPVAYGTDQRGRWVEVTLMYIAGVIGAIPRMGKTFLLRLLLLIAALDPRAELHTYDMKGTGDLDPVGNAVSHRHAAGDDDESIAYALADFRALREELRRRTKVIRSLPRDICPESKVTSALADKRSLGLHPIVVGVDECQVLFEHPDHGKEFEEIATDLVKRDLRPASWSCWPRSARTPSRCPPGSARTRRPGGASRSWARPRTTWCWAPRSTSAGCAPPCSPGVTRAFTTSSARAPTLVSSPRSTSTPPAPRPSPRAPAPRVRRLDCCPATRSVRHRRRSPAPRMTCWPTSSPWCPRPRPRCGRKPSLPGSPSCAPRSTADGTPTRWPPRSSRTA